MTALVFGGATLLIVLVLTAAVPAIVQRQIERQTGPSFETLAYQVGDKLERTIYERLRQLQFTANLAAFRATTTPLAERRAVLESLLDASPDYAWIGFADPTGTVIAASEHLFEQDKVGDVAWFRGGRRQFFVGAVRAIPALAAARPTTGADAPRFLDLALPVADTNGRFLGVLGAQLRWSWAREVQLSVIPDSARRDHLGVTVYSATGEIMLDSGASGWTEPPDAPPGLSISPGTHGVITENIPGGTVYLTGYARARGFREFRGQGWLVVVRQPVSDVFAAVHELRLRTLRLGLGLTLALGLFSWIFTARLERRFRAISTAAGRIGAGDILTLLPMPRGDSDFARMCAALGEMVGKFRERNETLETENAHLAGRPRD